MVNSSHISGTKGFDCFMAGRFIGAECPSWRNKGIYKSSSIRRFINTSNPVGSIASYLIEVYKESLNRGYKFDKNKINKKRTKKKIKATQGQLGFELAHLRKKLKKRDIEKYKEIIRIKRPDANRFFKVDKGDIESWGKI